MSIKVGECCFELKILMRVAVDCYVPSWGRSRFVMFLQGPFTMYCITQSLVSRKFEVLLLNTQMSTLDSH